MESDFYALFLLQVCGPDFLSSQSGFCNMESRAVDSLMSQKELIMHGNLLGTVWIM